MNKIKVLLIEDDRSISNFITATMDREGYKIMHALNGREGLSLSTSFCPNVILLDLGLPDMDGLEVLQKLRSWSDVPVIIISARTKEQEKVSALDLGADDYIVKPFSPREVVARIKAVLRRTSEQQSNDDGRVTLNGLVIDIKSYTVTLKGQPVICTPKEIEILYMLASNPGQVFTREQLLNKVWGYDFAGETRTVDTHIKRIRAKLDNTGLNWSIKTIYGVGYKFEVE